MEHEAFQIIAFFLGHELHAGEGAALQEKDKIRSIFPDFQHRQDGGENVHNAGGIKAEDSQHSVFERLGQGLHDHIARVTGHFRLQDDFPSPQVAYTASGGPGEDLFRLGGRDRKRAVRR